MQDSKHGGGRTMRRSHNLHPTQMFFVVLSSNQLPSSHGLEVSIHYHSNNRPTQATPPSVCLLPAWLNARSLRADWRHRGHTGSSISPNHSTNLQGSASSGKEEFLPLPQKAVSFTRTSIRTSQAHSFRSVFQGLAHCTQMSCEPWVPSK